MHAIKKAKAFVEDKKWQLAAVAAPVIMTAQSTIAHAAGGVKVPKVSVSDDGTVNLGDGASGTDIKSGFNTLIGNSQFVLGAIVTVAALFILGFGLWRAQKAARELQDNSPMGWQSAGNILKGTIVGGILFAIIGIVLAASAATGANMFTGK